MKIRRVSTRVWCLFGAANGSFVWWLLALPV